MALFYAHRESDFVLRLLPYLTSKIPNLWREQENRPSAYTIVARLRISEALLLLYLVGAPVGTRFYFFPVTQAAVLIHQHTLSVKIQ